MSQHFWHGTSIFNVYSVPKKEHVCIIPSELVMLLCSKPEISSVSSIPNVLYFSISHMQFNFVKKCSKKLLSEILWQGSLHCFARVLLPFSLMHEKFLKPVQEIVYKTAFQKWYGKNRCVE